MTFALLCLNVFTAQVNKSFAQIITYTNDTGGVMNMVATNVTAGNLTRVNGASRLSSPCTHGFSTRGFSNNTTYNDTMKAVEVSVAPNSGFKLVVDTLLADLRHSTTGPAKARFAYSTDGGTTWTDQGTDQLPYGSSTCDSMTTCKWQTSINVNYPGNLLFRVYGFDASVATGTGNMQILNLAITGSVISSTMVNEVAADENKISIYPNPMAQNTTISYNLTANEFVSIRIYNMLGQQVSQVAATEFQQAGAHNYTVPVVVPGLYFVKLSIGDQTYTRKIVKL